MFFDIKGLQGTPREELRKWSAGYWNWNRCARAINEIWFDTLSFHWWRDRNQRIPPWAEHHYSLTLDTAVSKSVQTLVNFMYIWYLCQLNREPYYPSANSVSRGWGSGGADPLFGRVIFARVSGHFWSATMASGKEKSDWITKTALPVVTVPWTWCKENVPLMLMEGN